MSKDGFIARSNGDVSWLEDLNIDPDETGLAEFFASVDGLVMGRGTYDFVFDYGTWPYEDKPAWVCTSRPLTPLDGAKIHVASTVAQVIEDAKAMQLSKLWLLGGGQLASAFLEAGLITSVSVSEMPIELGEGIPLFANHRLAELHSRKREVIPKKGFRQLEIEL